MPRPPLSRRAMVALLCLCPIAIGAQSLATRSCHEAVPADPGFEGVDCIGICTVHSREGWVEFTTEPVIRGVRADGPARGLLEEGDRVEMVDDLLITTPAGGKRWARLLDGEPARLQLRRNGRVRVVLLRPAVPGCPDAAPLPRARIDRDRDAPRGVSAGGLGMALRCDAACRETGGPDGRAAWSFEGPPTVARIVPGGAADRAGVRVGDILLAVDGLPITRPEAGALLGRASSGRRVELTLRRGAAIHRLDVASGGER